MKKRKKGEKWKIRTVSVHLTTLERKGLLSGALYVLLVATPNCDAAINVPPDYVYIIPHFSTFVNRFFKSFSGFFEKLFLTLFDLNRIFAHNAYKMHKMPFYLRNFGLYIKYSRFWIFVHFFFFNYFFTKIF